MKLFRATQTNGLFDALKAQWDAEIERHDDAPTEFYEVLMGHAASIVSETPADPRYGIFVLCEGGDAPTPPYEGMVHVNHKLPGTSATEVRMVWHLIAPRYQYQEPPDIDRLVQILASFLAEGVVLASGPMRAPQVKIYLQNAYDRTFARTIATLLPGKVEGIEVAVKGNWLHISIVTGRGRRA